MNPTANAPWKRGRRSVSRLCPNEECARKGEPLSSAQALRQHIETCSKRLKRKEVTDTSGVPQPPALGPGGAPTVGQPSTQRTFLSILRICTSRSVHCSTLNMVCLMFFASPLTKSGRFNTCRTLVTLPDFQRTSGDSITFGTHRSGTDLHVTERSLRNTEYGLPIVFRVTSKFIRSI